MNKQFDKITQLSKAKLFIEEKNNYKHKKVINGIIKIRNNGIKIGNVFLEYKNIKGLSTFLKRYTEFIYENKYIIRIKTENESLLLYYLLRRYKDVYSNN
ncbi:hypothetical protein [Thermosipho atlanticus]|uniref:hypothetical protein n=1 Tax=Thermosipho atlanticus TaxID=238991 RepID=UPI001F47C290|nr:hypothetical protein [Thermosipho atlanticus]